jgi:HEAT repeats
MKFARKIIVSAVVLFFTIVLLHPSGGKLFASEYDPFVAELRKADWHAHFSTGPEKERLNSSFDTLLGLVKNKGIDWRIRIRGIILLGETSNPKRAAILIHMYHNPFFNAGCPSIKMSLVIALSNIDNDSEVVDTLIEGMRDSELEVREASIQALGRLGSGRAVPFLIGALNDRSFAIRRSAILSLSRIRDRRALPFLKNIADGDSDRLLRNEAASALTKMKS